jgi:exonuclease III
MWGTAISPASAMRATSPRGWRTGVTIHNFYVPAGGDVPDREVNEKFGHKLDFLTEMRDWFRASGRKRRSWSAISTSPRARTTSGATSSF